MLRSKLVFISLLISLMAHGQANRYMVFFKDKLGTPYSITSPDQFLSAKSIERRLKQGITIKEEDLPVTPDYVTQVKATGAKTFFTSRWWNGVLVETNSATLAIINSLPFVRESVLVAPGSKLMGGRITKIKQRKNSTAEQPVNQLQLQQIGLDEMHASGNKGEGISIAIFDSGFQGVNVSAPFADLFTENRVKQTFNFVKNTSGVYQTDDHGTEVLSVMGAFSPGSYTGGAYKADYFLYLTEDVASEYRIEEYNWAFAAERADSAGVEVINSSLGYYEFDDNSMDYQTSELDGRTAVITQTARKAIERGIIVVCSAGNEGSSSWKLVTPPSDAEGILAIGSINSAGMLSNFSSRGPTADGRIKPDVVALGSGTSVIRASGALGTASGTSLSSPLVASLAAGVWQAFPSLSAETVVEAILNSASQAQAPDNLLGYGIPHFRAINNYLESEGSAELISVYPNPVSGDSFQIRLKEPVDTPVQVTIFDSRGSRVADSTLQINWFSNPFQYDISKFMSGLYFVRVKSGTTTATIRIAKL